MDVLHIIKTDHDRIRQVLDSFELLNGVQARRKAFPELSREIETHILLEEGYLYPEIADLFSGSQILVDIGRACHAVISKTMKSLDKALDRPSSEQDLADKRFAELKEQILKHFQSEEEQMMPRVRQLITTQEREDLGQVFADAKDLATKGELTLADVSVPAGKKVEKRRKRA